MMPSNKGGTGTGGGEPLWRCTEVAQPSGGGGLATCRFRAENLQGLRGHMAGGTAGRLEWDLPATLASRFKSNQAYPHDALAAPWWRCLELTSPSPGAATVTCRFQAEGLGDLKGDLQGAKNGRLEWDLPIEHRNRFRQGAVYTHHDLAEAEQAAGAR
jgi:hypothetical protein